MNSLGAFIVPRSSFIIDLPEYGKINPNIVRAKHSLFGFENTGH